MTSPIEKITITCPGCGLFFEGWHRASINLALDNFNDQYLDEATTSTCPHCGHKVSHAVLVVRKDGVWEIEG